MKLRFATFCLFFLTSASGHDRQETGVSVRFEGKSHPLAYQFLDTKDPGVYTVNLFFGKKLIGTIPQVLTVYPRLVVDLGKDKPEEALLISVDTPTSTQIWTIGRVVRMQQEIQVQTEPVPGKNQI